MEIILAKQAGFCFGVKRATQIAFSAAEKKEGNTYTIGPIIHSPQVVQRLAEMGVQQIDDLQGIESGTVIIRSHGVPESEVTQAEALNLQVLDATCPFVKKAQEYVKTLSEEGYTVIVVGEADHPEVKGIISYAGTAVHVVASGADVKALPKMKKVGIVAQTTQSIEQLRSVVDQCLLKSGELRIYNTICDATSVRQDEARFLAAHVDAMIVIGGFNSANTRRLAEICMEIQPATYHIESSAQLKNEWFDHVERVGVTAGASTPKWLIDEILERIKAVSVDKKD
jgi:4-hydroxy-3-methylbut-2-enyl diphosphate reductase